MEPSHGERGDQAEEKAIRGEMRSSDAVTPSQLQHPNAVDVTELNIITINELGEYEEITSGGGEDRTNVTPEGHQREREKTSSHEPIGGKKKRKHQSEEETGQRKKKDKKKEKKKEREKERKDERKNERKERKKVKQYEGDVYGKRKRLHQDVAEVREKKVRKDTEDGDFPHEWDRPGGSGVSPAGPGHRTPLSIRRFIFHKVIGQGSFGKVLMASDTVTRRQLAVKVIKKREVLQADVAREVLVEREALHDVSGTAFIIRGLFAFQTEELLFLGMELAYGGDLFDLLETTGPLGLTTSTFYAAEIVSGLEHLHSKGFIHRDIKPENILIDGAGHMKIADLGLALNNMHEGVYAFGCAGTPGYIAPEMEDHLGYNRAADWFSFGIVLFQMLTGESPFLCRLLDLPGFLLDSDAEDIIEKLVCEDPDKRLGADGVIRYHPFFWSIDWVRLEALQVPPPFIPSKPSEKSLPHLALDDLLSGTTSACAPPISSFHQELFREFSFNTSI